MTEANERPAIQCSQGGVPFNDFHLKEKDAIIASLRAQLAAAQASERERCAKVAINEAGMNLVRSVCGEDSSEAHEFARHTAENIAAAIRALSPTANQEKPE